MHNCIMKIWLYGLNPAHIPYCWMINPMLLEFCFIMNTLSFTKFDKLKSSIATGHPNTNFNFLRYSYYAGLGPVWQGNYLRTQGTLLGTLAILGQSLHDQAPSSLRTPNTQYLKILWLSWDSPYIARHQSSLKSQILSILEKFS